MSGSERPAAQPHFHESQTSRSVLLVRPTCFSYNPETARSNHFARHAASDDLASLALSEFDSLQGALNDAGIETLILPSPHRLPCPDAVFPNNWVSFHADGTLVIYPMSAASRRVERQPEQLGLLLKQAGFKVEKIIDLSLEEDFGRFLEGTGSVILDRTQRRAYAALSPRTHPEAISLFNERLGYSTFTFKADDPEGRPVYHTNVIMSLGKRFALICSSAVDQDSKPRLIEQIESTGRTVIDVNFNQVRQFACNVIELSNDAAEAVLAMSTSARRSLRKDQLRDLEQLVDMIVDVDIPTIEAVAGGSVRCMIADIHLPKSTRSDCCA